jgi:membrane protease YdiL (CAAX protease family)
LITVGVVFGIYHFVWVRFLVTALLGVVLAYLCWQSRSIWPCMVAHVLHNAMTLSFPHAAGMLGLEEQAEGQHLPFYWIMGGILLFAAGLWLCRRPQQEPTRVAAGPATDALQPSA